jgi:hypothetical protein
MVMVEGKQNLVHIDEATYRLAQQIAADLAKSKADMIKLAIVVRDLVYMELTEGETEHTAALSAHQEALNEIIGEVDE